MATELDAARRISADLGLPEVDSYTQDWAYELPEKFRSEQYVYRYVRAYDDSSYGDVERRLLVRLILDVTNDIFEQDEKAGRNVWRTVVSVLRKNPSLHRDQVLYWAALGESLDEAFAIAPLAREAMEELYT